MEEKDKLKVYENILKKSYPFISKLEIDDDSYASTVFITARIDIEKFSEIYDIKEVNRNLSDFGFTSLSSFTRNENEDKKEKLRKLKLEMNSLIQDLRDVLPEKYRFKKIPELFTFISDKSTFR